MGESWLPRRKGFNVGKWRAACHCRHSHEQHSCATGPGCEMACVECGCGRFRSAFACLCCDGSWEQHSTVWESRDERERMGRAVDEQYMPLAETPQMRSLVFGQRAPPEQPAAKARAHRAQRPVGKDRALGHHSSSRRPGVRPEPRPLPEPEL